MPVAKIFKADTKVKIISNTNGVLDWKSNITGRHIKFLKAGTPKTINFEELEDMVWSGKTLVQEGLIYVPDKEAFYATGIQNIEWESIKPITIVKKMLAEMDAETLRDEAEKMSPASKELLAEEALEDFENLKGSVVSTVEQVTKVNISQMKEDEKANKEHQKKSKEKE
jgi:hypothetical protein